MMTVHKDVFHAESLHNDGLHNGFHVLISIWPWDYITIAF